MALSISDSSASLQSSGVLSMHTMNLSYTFKASAISPPNVSTVSSILFFARLGHGGFPRSKNGAANAYNSRSLFHCHLKISAHSHAQMGQGRAERLLAFRFQFRQAAKDRPDFFGFQRPGGDG